MESPASRTAAPKARRALKILAIQLALWPLLLLGAEFGLRIIQRLRGKPHSSSATHAAFEEIQRQNHGFVPQPDRDLPWNPVEDEKAQRVLHPYVGFEIVGGIKQLEDEVQMLRLPHKSDRYVIVVLGGSVAEMFGSLGTPKLAQMLRSDARFADKEIHFVPLGRGGFRQPQQQSFLAYILTLSLPIQAVIELDGFNEVAIGNQNAQFGAHDSFPSIPHWSHLVARGAEDEAALEVAADIREVQRAIDAESARALAWHVEDSAIASKWCLARLRSKQSECAQLYDLYTIRLKRPSERRALSGPRIPVDAKDPIASSVAVWSESSRNLRAMCDGRGIRYFHVLQPTLHDPGAKRVSQQEKEVGTIDARWLEGVERGYPLLRAAGAKLAQEGEWFYDATRIFAEVDAPLYIDSCHLDQAGNDLLAEAIGKALLAALPQKL